MRVIADAHCKFSSHLDGLQLNVCTKFEADSCYILGVIVAKVVLGLFAFSDPKIQDGHPKIKCNRVSN